MVFLLREKGTRRKKRKKEKSWVHWVTIKYTNEKQIKEKGCGYC